MFGLVIALLGAAWQYATNNPNMYVLYATTVSWLHSWYIITTVLILILYIIGMVVVSLGLTGLGIYHNGLIGGVLGFLGGSALSNSGLIWIVISRACLIFGSLLLSQALHAGGEPTWDTVRLTFGCALILLGLITSKSSVSVSMSLKN